MRHTGRGASVLPRGDAAAETALAVPGLLALGAAVRLLRFWGPFPLWAHWDEVRLALPALAILDGAFAVHHLGVEYMGASPAYPLAVWFAVAGHSPLALDVFAYGVGLGILATGWLLARRLLAPPAARLALATLAIPPLLLARWSLNGNLNYPLLLVLGNLFLLGTHTLFFRGPARRASFLGLGLLAGLGCWTNLLFVVYLAPLGWLALSRGLVWQARAWLFPLGALLGSLPMWLYELDAFPSARFAVTESGQDPGTLGTRAWLLLGGALPTLLGVEDSHLRGLPASLLAAAVLAVGVVALGRALVRPGRAGVLLWGVFVANVALLVLTSRGAQVDGTGVRYLLPLYSVLPCWIGAALAWLVQTRRLLGAAAVAAVFGFQLWANWDATLGTTPPGARRWAILQPAVASLVQWLEARGIRRVYWADIPGMPAYEFTYLAGRRIVAAHPWREEALDHSHLVDADPNPPFIIVAEMATALRASLAGLGMPSRETTVGRIRLIEPVPALGLGFAPLPRDGWIASASDNAEAAPRVLDHDASSAWRTGNQAPGQWLRLDLGAERVVARVDLLTLDWREVPAGFRVEVSRDGAGWETVADVPRYWGPLFLAGPHPVLKVRRGRVQAIFRPVRARHVQVVQTGADPSPWAVRELFVYAPAPEPPPPPRPGELVVALEREGVRWLYADAWGSAAVKTASRGWIQSQESNLFVNSYGRDRPDPARLDRFRAGPGRAILLGADADAEGIRATLAGQGIAVREAAAGPYRLFLLGSPPAAPRRLASDGWSATASEAAADAWRVIDGDPATVWTAPGPAGPDTSLTLDLRTARVVGRVRVRPGVEGGGLADLRLEGSTDGIVFSPLGPIAWAGALYWTGHELLRSGPHAWEVAFPPARLRYLRLHPAAARPGPWVIREIECFE